MEPTSTCMQIGMASNKRRQVSNIRLLTCLGEDCWGGGLVFSEITQKHLMLSGGEKRSEDGDHFHWRGREKGS